MLKFGDESECVSWNFSGEVFSSIGCQIVSQLSNRNKTICECDHLSNFVNTLNKSGRHDSFLIIYLLCGFISIYLLISCIIWIIWMIYDSFRSQPLINNALLKMKRHIKFNRWLLLLLLNMIIILVIFLRDTYHQVVY
jgi:hypothetical protein